MNPRRLFVFLGVFLVVAASYFLLTWREKQKEVAEQAAKRLYQVKEADITALTLKKGSEVIHLEKKGEAWQITQPIKTKADEDIVRSLLATLAHLNKDRDLGLEKNLSPFGLDKPPFIVEFTANGKVQQLLVGNPTPGKQGYYVLRDQHKDLLVIRAADKESLDRPLTALRDKTLLDFSLDKVKALKIRLDSHQVDLEKAAPDTWKWQGKEQFKVRADRVESLLRRLDLARIKDFVAEAPGAKELAAYGLAPRSKGAVTVEEKKSQETILLGDKHQEGIYARKGSTGPVFLVEERLKNNIEQTIAALEDRRLWSGPVADVQKVTWGPPDKLWTAVKEEKSWQLTGPAKESLTQSSVRLEMALLKFQDLEYARLVPATKPPAQKKHLFELRDAAGQLLFRLAEIGTPEKARVEVSLEEGQGKIEYALVPLKPYQEWREDMDKLTKKPR